MTTLTLEQNNHAQIAALLSRETWVVACLCAAWCDVCNTYRPDFDKWAMQHPDVQFLWIDIEDQADVVGDFDVENFPTLLMQRGDLVAFYGTVLPDTRIADRLLLAQTEKSHSELLAESVRSEERRHWQQEANLRRRLLPT